MVFRFSTGTVGYGNVGVGNVCSLRATSTVTSRMCAVARHGDNSSAVTWVHKRRGGEEPRSGFSMRMLGGLGMASGWVFEAKHVPEIPSDVAHGISRWPMDCISAGLLPRRFDIRCHMQDIGAEGMHRHPYVSVLSSSEMPLRCRLQERMRGTLGRGFSSRGR